MSEINTQSSGYFDTPSGKTILQLFDFGKDVYSSYNEADIKKQQQESEIEQDNILTSINAKGEVVRAQTAVEHAKAMQKILLWVAGGAGVIAVVALIYKAKRG